MRIRRTLAILGAGLVLTGCLMLYLMMDLTLFPQEHGVKLPLKDNQWLHFEDRLAKLEKDFKRQHKTTDRGKSNQLTQKDRKAKADETERINRSTIEILQQRFKGARSTTCNLEVKNAPDVDIQMLEMYKQLVFDNPDGGVWKQGWKITYDDKQWNPNRKLKVFVVPHSHNDPGWLQTFEKYYVSLTQGILNNMVTKLTEDRRRKFIWAEVSFLKLWWDEQSKKTRDSVRQLVYDGQLEIVAGGWVMPDESSSHWMAQLTQLTEGHQWLRSNLDYVPKSGWAIDPFGLSPTMPYLLKGSGLENQLIQRVHYSVKKRLAKEKSLEFRWRQLWDNDGSTGLLTHVMPFYSYDVPHTCGPDPKVCCQFDFARLPNSGLTCPWRVSPQLITGMNVAERSALLLDQYRKKAQLFNTNVVLVPLGDDFRYARVTEWNAQFNNYQNLIDHMNSNKHLNVQIQFGTLSDYFDAVRAEQKEFPSLSGDFFTYADRDDHYWSGYYTSRPFHKRLDRVLLGALRSSEALAAIGWARGSNQLAEGSLADRISDARRWHSLFQHHDGITGTARDNVVVDYAQKMIKALKNSEHVLQQSVAHLLNSPQGFQTEPEAVYFSVDDIRSHHTSAGERLILTVGEDKPSKKVIFYNPLSRQRTNIQTLIVSTPFVKVTDRMGQPVKCQVSPIWVSVAALSATRFELSFLISVPGLGLATYLVHALHGTSLPSEVHLANVTVFNTPVPPSPVPGFAHLRSFPTRQEFSIGQRPELSASFGVTGLLKALRVGNTTFPVHLEFVKYGTVGPSSTGRERSGAYLFLPDKPEPDLIQVDLDRAVHLVTGPLLSRVYIQLQYVQHICTLFNSPGSDGLGLQIINKVDITETSNFELVMRLNTDIASGDQFFTDLNGLNMIRRQRFPKLPTQGNYYPLPAAVYIEDKRVRLTVATAQPLGVASMAPGQIEIMQDRRLMQDDNRGLGQGVTDNLPTHHLFTLVLERKMSSCPGDKPAEDHPAGFLSLGGHLTSQELSHPVVTVFPNDSLPFEPNPEFSPLRFDLPADMSVASLRVFPIPEGAGKGMGMVLHRQALDLCWGEAATLGRFNVADTGEVDLTKFLGNMEDWTISEAPLTFHSVGPTLKSPVVSVCPHQLRSILFHKTQS